MVNQSFLLFWSACAALLILACLVTGCTNTQSPVTPAAITQPASTTGSGSVTIQNFAFSPATLTIKTGTTITWTNKDSTPHQVASDSGSLVTFTSGTLANGAAYQFTFTQPGTFTYHCTIHPSMTGTIIVQS